MMKKKITALIYINLCILFFLFFGVGCMRVIAANAQEIEQDALNETIEEQMKVLDFEALQEYIDSLGSFSGKSVPERLIEYIKCDSTDYGGIGRQISTVLFAKLTELLPSFACIAAITLLSGLISTMKSGATGNTAADMIFLITYAAALIPLLVVLTECFHVSLECISAMQTQMQLVFPLMLTLMSASGGTVTAAVCRPAVAFFSTNIVSIIYSLVLPITMVIIVLSIASNMTKELKIGKFTAFFKSINKWLIGICISAFGIFFTLQGITAANYDGILRRTAKYAIGNGIPIVGGFLSGGFDLAVAGSILIKNSLGSMSIFLMLTVVFEPIVLLVSVNLLLRLTAAIAQPFGDGRIADCLEETAGNLQYCIAGILFTAFLYFLSIMLLVCATEALF
jgi:stage III sporulation protein AE